MRRTVAMFGEAEMGQFQIPHVCHSLDQLAETLGNPPEESLGLYYAVQALLYENDLIFFRVREEGFSIKDYLQGFKYLENKNCHVDAIGIPGVGSPEVIHATSPICHRNKSFLIITEKDLYDYLTSLPRKDPKHD